MKFLKLIFSFCEKMKICAYLLKIYILTKNNAMNRKYPIILLSCCLFDCNSSWLHCNASKLQSKLNIKNSIPNRDKLSRFEIMILKMH